MVRGVSVGTGDDDLAVVPTGHLRESRAGQLGRGGTHRLRRPGSESPDGGAPAGDRLEHPDRRSRQTAPGDVEVGARGLAGVRRHHRGRPDGHRRDRHHPDMTLPAPEQGEVAETGDGGVEDGLVVVDTQPPRHRTQRHRPGIGTHRGGGGQDHELRPRQGPQRAGGGRRQPQPRREHVDRGRGRGGHIWTQLAHADERVIGQSGQPRGEVRLVAGGTGGTSTAGGDTAGGGSGTRHDPSQPSEIAAAVRTVRVRYDPDADGTPAR